MSTILNASILYQTIMFKSSTVNNVEYSFNKFNKHNKVGGGYNYNESNKLATNIIKTFFYSLGINNSNTQDAVQTSKNLISTPTFKHTNSKVTIQVFYYVPKNKSNKMAVNIFKNNSYFSGLSTTLGYLFKKEVNLVLIRVYYPYLNSSIFSQYLVHNASTNTFLRFQRAILKFPSIYAVSLPAHISGIKVQLSGRLTTQKVVPRVTVKSTVIGSFSVNDPNTLIDYSKHTAKNKLGAFTIKVWISQRIPRS